MQVGWIGLGAMGAPMAACLAREGHRVAGFDLDVARMAKLAAEGGTAVESAALAARGAEVLAIMVATPDQVQASLFDSGAVDELSVGAHVLLMATVGPDPVIAWDEALSVRGLKLVDAPVSGGVTRAAVGELLIMAGGPPDSLDFVRPLLSIMGREVAIVGARAGDGQRVKLVNQLLCGVHIAVAGEALAFAEALGLDARACWEVVRHGAAASFMLDDRGSRMLQTSREDVQSALDIFVKDMGLVVNAARDRDFGTPLARVAQQLYLSGSRTGLGRADDSAIIEVLRHGRANTTVSGWTQSD
jgi:3-hydroxyisobutyrate dehydrogenase/putative dehydrogenase